MLILKFRLGETLVLETETEQITIYFDLNGSRIKVGIDAPLSVNIVRGELLDYSDE